MFLWRLLHLFSYVKIHYICFTLPAQGDLIKKLGRKGLGGASVQRELLRASHISRSRKCVVFHDWLHSLSMTFLYSRSDLDQFLIFHMPEKYFIARPLPLSVCHSSSEGHFGCLHFEATISQRLRVLMSKLVCGHMFWILLDVCPVREHYV